MGETVSALWGSVIMNSTELPSVSAIVPVFNKAPYIVEAIRSLQDQNYPNLEVVLVDDGSTDESYAVVQQLPQLFPLLKIKGYQQRNGGASDARNAAIARSTGQYIVNMDADDIMTPGFLAEAVSVVVQSGADVVYSDLELFGDRTGEWIPHPFDPYYIRYDNCVPSLALFPRALWEKVGGYNVALPFSEDWNFFVALTRYTHKFHKIPRKAFRYRQTETGLYHNFIRDAWEWGSPLLMCAQDDLYAVDEVLQGCEKLKGMPERWTVKIDRFRAIHTNNWLPSFWIGLVAERRGELQRALEMFQRSVEISSLQAWLPLYTLGKLVQEVDKRALLEIFHRVRILRPDMARVVNPIIESMTKST